MQETANSGRARRSYADGPFGQVHFYDLGSGRPLVLLHQAPMSAHQFDTVMPLLSAAGVRAIAIDLPGYGGSDGPDAPPTIADYATAIPCVLDTLGIDQADVLGHHTGALVATELALSFPKRVGKLILNGPVPLTPEEQAVFREDSMRREKASTVMEPDGSHLSTAFQHRAAFVAGSVPLERVQQYVLWMASGSAPVWYGHNAAFSYDHVDRMAGITHETLVLTNTGDIIYEHVLRTKSLRPDFAFFALEGGGVDVVDQLPQAWTAAVVEFLNGSGAGTTVTRPPAPAAAIAS
jgi:pimeloyl-ACP methyl ester carboxylesterase